MKKLLALLLLILIIGFFSFYNWASSPNLDEKEYSKILKNSEILETKNDSVFSIITYNIGYLSGMTNNQAVERGKELFTKNLIRLKRQLETIDADILALQEIDFNASRSYNVNQLKEVMSTRYPYAAKAINWDEHYLPFPYGMPSKHFGKLISGQSIISKFKITNHERLVLKRVDDLPFYQKKFYLDRLAQAIKIIINDREVVVINIHLEAFNKATRNQQADQVIELFNKYKNDYPTILLGDFNSAARDSDAVIKKFLRLDGVGCAAYTEDNYKNTFSSVNPIERIDYIFYNTEFIKELSGEVLTYFGDISDHLPVMMTFKLLK